MSVLFVHIWRTNRISVIVCLSCSIRDKKVRSMYCPDGHLHQCIHVPKGFISGELEIPQYLLAIGLTHALKFNKQQLINTNTLG